MVKIRCCNQLLRSSAVSSIVNSPLAWPNQKRNLLPTPATPALALYSSIPRDTYITRRRTPLLRPAGRWKEDASQLSSSLSSFVAFSTTNDHSGTTDTRSSSRSGGPENRSPPPPPDDFGYNPYGPEIANKDTILSEVDAALGASKPPDLEIFLTEHLCATGHRWSTFVHLNLLRFGHVAIRYRTSDGVDHLMNVHGDFSSDPHAKMINFIHPPSEYLFGTDPKQAGQGGVYNRPIVSVRVENVVEGAIDALHAYYLALDKASAIGTSAITSSSSSSTTTRLNRHREKPRAGNEGVNSVTNCTTRATIEDEANSNRTTELWAQPGSSRRGSVRFQLVDVNLSNLARNLPEPLGKIPEKIATFFQRQHERFQQGNNAVLPDRVANNSAGSSNKNNLLDATLTSLAVLKGRGDQLQKQLTAAEHEVLDLYDDARQATFVAGNCAQWTSRGLSFCGLLRRPRIFPKSILIELLEDEYLVAGRKENVHVIVYEEVEHAKKKTDWGSYKYLRSAYVHPLRPLRNWWYREPRDFASVIVSVPKGTDKAIVQRRDRPLREPRQVFRYISAASAVVPAAIMVGLVDHIGPMGPVAAATWLGLNWWLH
jgi:hypothetical protein